MNQASHSELYADHIEELRQRYDAALKNSKLDAVLIANGRPASIFLDDQQLPFKANPHLLQWAPLVQHPDAVLSYQPGKTPELLILEPQDYWHRHASLPAILETGLVEVQIISDARELLKHVSSLPKRSACIAEIREPEDSFGLKNVNPQKLLDDLHYRRAIKTPWEVECIRQANLLAIPAHLAAEACFHAGGSEYDIQLIFRSTCQQTDEELPYPAIVAINQHAATLHYQQLDRHRVTNHSLLIDAGCKVQGYASDISRSYSEDPVFGAMIQAMHELQRELCAAAQPGADFRDLHIAAHHSIAALLKESGVIDMTPDEAVSTRVSRSFFPHGLGHFLGLQVHDVGALLASAKGEQAAPPDDDPYLRLTRILEAGNVLTIEPGLYFIDVLLERLRELPEGKQVNWERVEELRGFGGIRIEDNLHITATGNQNLTRDAFAGLAEA